MCKDSRGVRIVLEDLPGLWLQISLLSLTWESATISSLVVTFVTCACVLVAKWVKDGVSFLKSRIIFLQHPGQQLTWQVLIIREPKSSLLHVLPVKLRVPARLLREHPQTSLVGLAVPPCRTLPKDAGHHRKEHHQ